MTYKDKASYGSCPPCTTVSTENAASPKSTKSRNLDSLVSRGINSNWDFGLIQICTEEFDNSAFTCSAFTYYVCTCYVTCCECIWWICTTQYKFKLRSWFNLNLYQEIWVSGFGDTCDVSETSK